ncbi:FadR/GntR family transcriptional regulator [Chitinimonas koreensis]|uniref:FadR/GntR family transcriptional regulator n=1 Tax=Chitinimonas koreensis TaxID=356302 RepID=UPI000686EBF4|nr:FadR/GntR family transcriptional regulator [Chitinimonas koreensis]QNM98804.1 FadR family transcriptional regulator [Chitinimonas koreensis]
MVGRLPQIEPKRLYRQIAGLIRTHIDQGEFAIGSYLPPERELAQQLGVSRASVREALIALEVEGRVSIRVGAGVQVLNPASAGGALAGGSATKAAAGNGGSAAELPEIGPLELLEARRLVESETAALAARNATEADIAALEAALARMLDEHAKGIPRHEGDRDFHYALARASGNGALLFMVATLWEQRYTPVFEKFEEHFSTTELYRDAEDFHQRILDAVRRRDATAARNAMKAHLDTVKKAFSRSLSGR